MSLNGLIIPSVTNYLSWITTYYSVWRHVFSDNCPCSYNSATTNSHSFQDYGIAANPSVIANRNWQIVIIILLMIVKNIRPDDLEVMIPTHNSNTRTKGHLVTNCYSFYCREDSIRTNINIITNGNGLVGKVGI